MYGCVRDTEKNGSGQLERIQTHIMSPIGLIQMERKTERGYMDKRAEVRVTLGFLKWLFL